MLINAEILKSAGDLHEKLHPEVEQISASVIHKSDDEKRLFYCVVIEPMTEVTKDGDAHGHVMKAEEIEESAHEFMLTGPVIYKQHIKKTDAKVVESYIAPIDFTPEGASDLITKGSWVMAVKVLDEKVWEDIKKGKITSFSPGGYGNITELDE